MEPKWKEALLYVVMASCLCVANTYTGIFTSVFIEVGYEHYAEVASLSTFLAHAFSSVINIAYVLLGVYWPQTNASTTRCLIDL